jgi:hypothetical protein
MTDIQQVDGLAMLDGLSAFEQFSRLRKLYIEQAESGDGPPDAHERRALTEVARRMVALIEPADLFLQNCQEQTEQVKDSPEFEQRLQALLTSDTLSESVKAKLTSKDMMKESEAGLQQVRELLADERQRLPTELEQLAEGQRPKRRKASDDVSADAEFGAGAGFAVGGTAIGVAVILAPKTLGLSVVIPLLAVGAAMAAAGTVMIVDAVLSS